MSETKLKPRQAIQNLVAFRVNRQAAANTGNGAFAQIAHDTEQYDLGGNVSGGTFTAPVSGYYQFNRQATITCDGTARYVINSLYIDGAEYSRGSEDKAVASTVYASVGSDIVYLAASSTADIRAYGEVTLPLYVGANTYYNYFSGFLVTPA